MDAENSKKQNISEHHGCDPESELWKDIIQLKVFKRQDCIVRWL